MARGSATPRAPEIRGATKPQPADTARRRPDACLPPTRRAAGWSFCST